MRQKGMSNHEYHTVIDRTIQQYCVDRCREFVQLCNMYKKCTDMSLRRQIRARKEELVPILTRYDSAIKLGVMNALKITYKETSKYPHLIEVERKRQHLIRSIS